MSTLIKLFASDLDGTLYNGLHQTDGGIVRRLRRVVGAGRHVALATGRWSSTGAELGFGDLPLEVVCGNGAFVYGASGELLRSVEFDRAGEKPVDSGPLCAALAAGDVAAVAARLHNNLAPAARALCPEAGVVESWLRGRPGVRAAQITGSGTCSFAICESSGAADAVAREAAGFGWRAWSTKTVGFAGGIC